MGKIDKPESEDELSRKELSDEERAALESLDRKIQFLAGLGKQELYERLTSDEQRMLERINESLGPGSVSRQDLLDEIAELVDLQERAMQKHPPPTLQSTVSTVMT